MYKGKKEKMENVKQLAMRVQELRTQKNFTVPQMAELLGVKPEEYQSYEDGSKQDRKSVV